MAEAVTIDVEASTSVGRGSFRWQHDIDMIFNVGLARIYECKQTDSAGFRSSRDWLHNAIVLVILSRAVQSGTSPVATSFYSY